MSTKGQPPKLFLRFFRWYCHPKLVKHIEGDLVELYGERVTTAISFKAVKAALMNPVNSLKSE